MRPARAKPGPAPASGEIAALRAFLAARRAERPQPSYRDLGAEIGVDKAVIWRVLNDGYEPTDPDIRWRLGLPTVVRVSLAGVAAPPPGTVLATDPIVCSCGRIEIPNHPLRTHCTVCRPIKRRRPGG